MFGTDRRAARVAWTVFLVALLLLIVYKIAHTLLVFVLAVLFAYLISPVVNFVQRFTPPRAPRVFSLAVVYLLLVAIIAIAAITIGGALAEQTVSLANNFPDLIKQWQQRLQEPGPPWFEPIRKYLERTFTQERLQAFAGEALPVLRKVGGEALSLAGKLSVFLLVPILAFFFIKDGAELKDNLVARLTSEKNRIILDDILADVHNLLGHFIRALVILSIATFVVYSIVLSIIGVPYSLLLAALAAILEFIPVIGPLVAIICIVLVAAVGGAGHILVILLFAGAYRLFQDYVLSPHLMSSGVELHPLLVIFGVLAGEQIAGIPGMFLSVPVMATLRVVYVRFQKRRITPAVTA